MTDNLNLTPKQCDAIYKEFCYQLGYKPVPKPKSMFYRFLNENTVEERRCQFCHTIIEKGEPCNCPPLE